VSSETPPRPLRPDPHPDPHPRLRLAPAALGGQPNWRPAFQLCALINICQVPGHANPRSGRPIKRGACLAPPPTVFGGSATSSARRRRRRRRTSTCRHSGRPKWPRNRKRRARRTLSRNQLNSGGPLRAQPANWRLTSAARPAKMDWLCPSSGSGGAQINSPASTSEA